MGSVHIRMAALVHDLLVLHGCALVDHGVKFKWLVEYGVRSGNIIAIGVHPSKLHIS